MAKRDFIVSLKQLRHFFNSLKEVHQQFDLTSLRLSQIESSTATVQEALQATVLTQD